MKEIDADCPNNILSTNSHTVHRSIDIHRN